MEKYEIFLSYIIKYIIHIKIHVQIKTFKSNYLLNTLTFSYLSITKPIYNISSKNSRKIAIGELPFKTSTS